MPSQPNGYSRSNTSHPVAGIAGRQTPWNPSQPAITSHASSCSRPAWRKVIPGAASKSCGAIASASNKICPAGSKPRGDEVLDDLVLAVDGHVPSGQRGEVDAMVACIEAQPDAVMGDPSRAIRAPRPASIRSCSVVCSSTPARMRCSTCSRVRASSTTEFDARQMQQVRKQQPGRAGTDDSNLGAHAAQSISSPNMGERHRAPLDDAGRFERSEDGSRAATPSVALPKMTINGGGASRSPSGVAHIAPGRLADAAHQAEAVCRRPPGPVGDGAAHLMRCAHRRDLRGWEQPPASRRCSSIAAAAAGPISRP